MKIELTKEFMYFLGEIVRYISNDKPLAAKKFKKQLIQLLIKDLQFPYSHKKSNYFDENCYRDYSHKGYTISFYINEKEQKILVIGIIKNKNSY